MQKPLAAHDSDKSAIIDYCQKSAFCSGELGAMGVCLGGHLAYRATLNSKIKSAFCLSATDIHSNTLPVEKAQQSLARMAEIEGEVHFVWGKQDPHVPHEGRLAIYNKLYSDGGFGVCINRPRGWSRDNK